MNRRLRIAVLALLAGLALPGIGFGGAVDPGEPPPGDGGDDVTTCDDDVAAAEQALEADIRYECNMAVQSPTYECRVLDVQKVIGDTKALCREDLLACDIDITDELNALEDEITAECNGDPSSPDYSCRVLDVQKLIADTVAETRQDCFDQPSVCGITLEAVLADATFGETEPNDHIVSADKVVSAVPIVGQMYAPADEDWYYIATSQINSIITIWFKKTNNSWHVELLDEAGNRLSASDTTKDAEFRFDTSVAKAGTYYVVVSNVGEGTDALYQMAVITNTSDQTDPQPSYNFHDVETEPNDYFTTGDPIASNVVTYGQLLDGADYDVFRIDSPGNEIMHIDLCYQNTTCAEEGAWAMFVVSSIQYGDIPCNSTSTPDANGGTPVTNCMLTNPLTIQVFDTSVGSEWVMNLGPDGQPILDEDGNPEYTEKAVSGYFDFTSDHIYYLFEYGRFDGALVGKVDPTWGDETGIDLALVDAGTYYVIVTPVLQRDSKGSVVQTFTAREKAPDIAGMIVFPYNDDQYTFRVTRTELDPSVASNTGNKRRATLDSSTGRLTIPEVNYAGDVYKMDLRLGNQGGRTFILENVSPVVNPNELP